MGAAPTPDPLTSFSAPTRHWFEHTFDAPTDAQVHGWPAISAGDHTLVLAPTGSGKTLAAFLWALDRLTREPVPASPKQRCRVLYVSPLKALAVDVEKNLRAPLAGIRRTAETLGAPVPDVSVAVRTGDTPAEDRRRLSRTPPDILITTPESLYLLLTSRAREILHSVETVIVDEIHSVAATKRGAHLALSLERLEAVTSAPPQRIGLSATQRPLDEIARFLGGQTEDGPRPVAVVDAGSRKALDIEVVVPIDDMGELGRLLDEPVSGPAAAGRRRRDRRPELGRRRRSAREAGAAGEIGAPTRRRRPGTRVGARRAPASRRIRRRLPRPRAARLRSAESPLEGADQGKCPSL
jgi:ATP-dependent helicase Lhr and Lhr-like helicase